MSIRNSESLATNAPNNSLATASRGKLLNFGIQAKGHQVALVIRVTAGENGNIDILAQVHPIDSLRVPEGLRLDIIDKSEQPFLQAKARRGDRFIQLSFFGEQKEQFKIKLTLGDDSITENFII